MADEPVDIVLVHLREMRTEMCEMREKMEAKLDQHDKRFDAIDKRLGEVHETALLAVGFAAMANHKLEQHLERIEDHERRIATLEQRP